MFLTVNGKEIIFSTFFWLSSSLKYPHCWCINLQWGMFNINTGTSASSIGNLYEGFEWIKYNINFKPDPIVTSFVTHDVAFTAGEKSHVSQIQSNQFEVCASCYKANATISCGYIAIGKMP